MQASLSTSFEWILILTAVCEIPYDTTVFQEVAVTSVKISGVILKHTYPGTLSRFVKGIITERLHSCQFH